MDIECVAETNVVRLCPLKRYTHHQPPYKNTTSFSLLNSQQRVYSILHTYRRHIAQQLGTMASGETRRNKQVIFGDYITGFPKESDMIVRDSTVSSTNLKAAPGGAMVVKNLYLSCDPYMRILMRKLENNKTFTSFTPGSVRSEHRNSLLCFCCLSIGLPISIARFCSVYYKRQLKNPYGIDLQRHLLKT